MAQRPTAIFADQIDDLALGNGLKKGTDDSQFEVAIKANDGLQFDTGELAVKVDNTTVEVDSSNGIQVKDGGIGEAKLNIFNSPTIGLVLGYTSNGLEWVSNEEAGTVKEADIVANEVPSGTVGGGNVNFTLANTPVAGTVQVFLNGLLQAPGSGLDYQIAGTTITFSKAPRSGSDIYVSYIIDN